ncbi:unnamed protein product, partial [Scytosiphon promiscuus]
MPSKIVSASSGCGGGGGGGSRGGESGGGGSTTGSSPRSAVGLAWEAFKAHGGGESVPATLKAAVTATTIGLEHVRKCTRERLLQEKGKGKGVGAGKRLSGPVQITLQDLEVTTPSQDKSSRGEGVQGTGNATSPSAAAAAQTGAGPRFNKDKMCWEGFEEPDLAGFATTDSESDSPSHRGRSDSQHFPRSRSTSPFGGPADSSVVEEGLDEDRRRMTASPLGLYLAAAASGAALESPRAGTVFSDEAVDARGPVECDVGDGSPAGGEGGTDQSGEIFGFLETPALRAGVADEGESWAEEPSGAVDGLGLAEQGPMGLVAPATFSAEPPQELQTGGPGVPSARETVMGSPQAVVPREQGVNDGLRARMESWGVEGDGGVEGSCDSGGGEEAERAPAEEGPRSRTTSGSSRDSSSEEISDWDKNLNSPVPGMFSHVPGADAAQVPSLMSRMSSQALKGDRDKDKDVSFCVPPSGTGSTGGRASVGVWSASSAGAGAGGRPSFGRTPSAGPVLFTPASMSLGLPAAAVPMVGAPAPGSTCAAATAGSTASLPGTATIASSTQTPESGTVAEPPGGGDGGAGKGGGTAAAETPEGSTAGAPCMGMGPTSGRADFETLEAGAMSPSSMRANAEEVMGTNAAAAATVG